MSGGTDSNLRISKLFFNLTQYDNELNKDSCNTTTADVTWDEVDAFLDKIPVILELRDIESSDTLIDPLDYDEKNETQNNLLILENKVNDKI